jgi:NADPH2:quinone reductase
MENERVVIPEYGPPSVLKLVREPMPLPAPGEVRIRVEAAGVSFGDLLQRTGLFYAGPPPMPYTPGYDVVGVVDEVGEGVDTIRPGARVAAFTLFGGYTRYLCVPASHVVDGVSPRLDAAQAVALILNYTTAYQMLRRIAAVTPGQSILVYSGSGGVGSALLDLARTMELVVAAAISRRWHDAFSGQARLLFDERETGGDESLRELAPHGFDAAFDPIGGSHVWRTRTKVRRGGKLVAFGIGSALRPDGKRDRLAVLRLGLLLAFASIWRRPRVELYAIDRRVKTRRPEIHDDLRALLDLLDRGAIRPRIGATFPLADAAKAHALLESRNNVGKIVLVP